MILVCISTAAHIGPKIKKRQYKRQCSNGGSVGLTSERNRAFVEGLALYDTVLSYDELADVPSQPTVFVDMAGSSAVRRAVHERRFQLESHGLVDVDAVALRLSVSTGR